MPVNTTIPRARFETAREMAFGSITNSFTRVGTVFGENFGIMYIQNFTDVTIDFSVSFDGTSVTFSLGAGDKLTTDMFANNLEIAKGESVFCKYRSAAPTSGFVQVALVSPA